MIYVALQLIVGDFGLSDDQERIHMGMWALMASPLLMSVDLRTIKPSSKALLLNPYVIAINQDSLGRQGVRISKVSLYKTVDNVSHVMRRPWHGLAIKKYRKVSNIRRTKSSNLNVSRLVEKLSLPNPMKPGVKCSCSSADRRCSNYIWVIDNFIVY